MRGTNLTYLYARTVEVETCCTYPTLGSNTHGLTCCLEIDAPIPGKKIGLNCLPKGVGLSAANDRENDRSSSVVVICCTQNRGQTKTVWIPSKDDGKEAGLQSGPLFPTGTL